jgi:hypothetical protein
LDWGFFDRGHLDRCFGSRFGGFTGAGASTSFGFGFI